MGVKNMAQDFKALVKASIEKQRQQLSELSLKIHSHPEQGFQEYQASEWLTQYLEANGYWHQHLFADTKLASWI